MSLIHYVPNTRVTPCLGCNELIADEDLVKHERHDLHSVHFWHPYHVWCLRDAPPAAAAHAACAECGEPFAANAIERARGWAMTFGRRLERSRFTVTTREPQLREDPTAAVPRPPGIRIVAVAAAPPWQLETHLELAHDACAADRFVTALRVDPGDDALRAVYADWLEDHGDLVRAEVVRLVIRRNAATGALRERLAGELRGRRRGLLGSWCRDVCARLR